MIFSRVRGYAWLIGSNAALLLSTTALAQSPSSADAPPPAPPPASTTPAPKPAADMQAVLDAQHALGAKQIEALTPAAARNQPSPNDGAVQVMKTSGMPSAPGPAVTTTDKAYGSDPM